MTFITFNDVTGGSCNLCGPSVTTQYASQGVIFDNPSFLGQDTVDTNLTYAIPGASFPNALYVEQGGHIGDGPAAPFQILFSVPITMAAFDYASSSDSFLSVTAYSMDGVLLETLDYFGVPTPIGLGGFAGIDESTPIGRLDLSYHPDYDTSRSFNFSIADLRFAETSTPEPATTLLVGIGICAIGFANWKLRFKNI
jgi:hypothetical protein